MSAVKSIALILSILIVAVALGMLIHPVMSLLFIVLAKVVDMLWSRGAPAFRQAYQQSMAQEKPKRKLKHLLTDDGEALDVVYDDDNGMESVVNKQHG
jgi:hypothetical protein